MSQFNDFFARTIFMNRSMDIWMAYANVRMKRSKFMKLECNKINRQRMVTRKVRCLLFQFFAQLFSSNNTITKHRNNDFC